MGFRTGFIVAAVGLASLLASAVVQAACSQADIAGEWQAYSTNWASGGRSYRVECSISVGKEGALGYSICTSSLGKRAPVINGGLTLSNAAGCSYRGSFLWMTAPNQITQMTLSSDKRSGTGTGKFPDGHFTFVMTKTSR
jgi:hypothetical protein